MLCTNTQSLKGSNPHEGVEKQPAFGKGTTGLAPPTRFFFAGEGGNENQSWSDGLRLALGGLHCETRGQFAI